MASPATQTADGGQAGAAEARELVVVRRFLDRVNSHDWEAVSQTVVERLSSSLTSLWLGHPNLRISPEWMTCHDDRVSLWAYGTGTHTRDWQLPASMGSLGGRRVAATGISWRVPWSVTLQVRRDRIVDVWGVLDWLSILVQLGVVRVACTTRPAAAS